MADLTAPPPTDVTPPAAPTDPAAVAVPAGLTTAPAANVPEPLKAPTAGGHPGGPHGDAADPAHDGLAQVLARQWPVLASSAAVCLLLGVIYLMLASKTYSAAARLRVSPMNAAALTHGVGDESGDKPQDEDYLETECAVIKSDAVLALALPAVADTRTLAGQPRPLEVLKAGLDAVAAKKGKIIEVSFESHSPADARRICEAVVDAYKAYSANYLAERVDRFKQMFTTGGQGNAKELQDLQRQLEQVQLVAGHALTADPEKSEKHLEVVALRGEKGRVDLDAIAARTAYQQAQQTVANDPAKRAAVERALQSGGSPADPQDQLKRYQDELQAQQARLDDARMQYMERHPVVQAIQHRIDALSVDVVVAAHRWQDAAETRKGEIERALAVAQDEELRSAHSQLEYTRLKEDVDRLTAQQRSVDNRISENDLARGAGAVNISQLDNPTLSPYARPGKTKTLAVAVVAGLLAGAGLGLVRDWADDRFRTLQAIRTAAGAPVLGAIPAIPAAVAATAADRGQVVHFDPFGDASESYRTLRTALQFGMPPRTKTILVTSPMAGDGKSTCVSNLAIAMAQANRRVIVVDADLRAPVQHRLFNLPDRVGLASVIDGTATLDEAVRRTNVPGLDVLPAGPIPSNPAEMVNDPSFIDYLNDLADRYDLVLVDSPPVTAVTDARILAALCDASLLVVRLGSSTKHQTERARDALRGVGARLVGVAVNGVSRRGNLASATGYYGRADAGPPPGGPLTVGPGGPTPPFSALNGAGRVAARDVVVTSGRAAPAPDQL